MLLAQVPVSSFDQFSNAIIQTGGVVLLVGYGMYLYYKYSLNKKPNGNGKLSGDQPVSYWDDKFDKQSEALTQIAANSLKAAEILERMSDDQQYTVRGIAVLLDRTTKTNGKALNP